MTQSRRKRGGATAGDPPRANAPSPPARAGARAEASAPFWTKPLADLTKKEWEALCDGCGRCCLVKLEDEDDGRIHFTDIACTLFDSGACRCRDYARRQRRVSDCVKLTPETVAATPWLPPTCAYRLRFEGKDLPAWHPLVSGDPDSVHEAGVSARGKVAAFEDDLTLDDYPDYIVAWPGKWPKGAARARKGKG
ncbi:MAG: YcgN family cysteine cluster protein [Hyphomicrobiales bacterium]|nr:YcgN family cysteine cluster protein [Hyphomicrobiales bacterium]